VVFSAGIHSDHPIAYLVLASFINVAFTWIALILILRMIEKQIHRLKAENQN
jgi:hypothetical protein